MEPGTDSPVLLASDSDGANLNSTPLAARMSASDADRESDAPVKKQRRVRTGCFTCRDRHLKCDEALGQCQNCRKSGRICRRGVRLNFVDTQVVAPPTYLQPPATSRVTFRDDSRTIASEYVGGFERYPPPEQEPSLLESHGQPVGTSTESVPAPLFKSSKTADRHLSFKDPAQVSLMQVFVEKVAPWIDVLDEMNHFSRILPLHALEEPMLYAAFAACAGSPSEDGMRLYNTAVQMLHESLSDPLRDSALCAATAVAVEVAEMLVLGPIEAQRPRAENAARSLIRECRWSPRSQGLGKACSWMSIVMELLDCLASHRALVWDPENWGVDVNFGQAQPSVSGSEETWTQRIIYICAKAAGYWIASLQAGQKPGGNTDINQKLQEWNLYNSWCDRWIALASRSLLPIGELQSWQANHHTVFPQIWLLGRTAAFAQLFYHLTRIILIKADPVPSEHTPEQQALQYHAYQLCGIISSEKNPGIPIFSIQLLAIAAECLVDREAQEEALLVFDKITHDAGLKTQQAKDKLVKAWGWGPYHDHQPAPDSANPGHSFTGVEMQPGTTDPALSFGEALESHPYLDHHFTSFPEL
ncbi:hypothetical protein BJY01DRAFT_226357 [Aspergillus pseudoustus]|uniref:Zn(2)-C6 fungal-type domain-containing protein n=1 Tax=Aspergillus pseudoustus TaxID=1810923 RepID=A0ABR4IW17_9EURO